MNPRIYQAVYAICDDYEISRNVRVTQSTRKMVAAMISGIAEDPHPNWDASAEKRYTFMDDYLKTLPDKLDDCHKEETPNRREITLFDFLHWFSKVFDQTICIIPKRR